MGVPSTHDAHRHLGVLPAYPFYGGPPVQPDTTARATIDELIADLDREGTERALVLPNYGVPDPDVAFALQRAGRRGRRRRDDRIRCGLWVSPAPAGRASAPRRRSRWPASRACGR